MEALNSYEKNNNLSSAEKELIKVYRNTLKSSNDYWTNYTKTHNKGENVRSKRLSCSTQTILWDGAGAAIGSFGGPVYAAIQSAIVSAAANEDCKD